jgi:hypothetical protein
MSHYASPPSSRKISTRKFKKLKYNIHTAVNGRSFAVDTVCSVIGHVMCMYTLKYPRHLPPLSITIYAHCQKGAERGSKRC